MLRRNSGRSMTLAARPQRHYLLKGLVRCGWCGMPMWAQTYKNGTSYYREHRESRSIAQCPAAGGSIACHVADQQVGKLIEALELGPAWLEAVLARINVRDETERVRIQRLEVKERLKRLARAYVDLLIPEEEYRRQKKLLELELETLVVPQANAAEEAGRLVQDLPRLWAQADGAERRRLLLAMLDGVYVDAREERAVVAIRAKAAFRPILQVATTREGSGVILVKEQPPAEGPEAIISGGATPVGEAPWCSWWRRGRVELPVQRKRARSVSKLS